jgi:hypothetical protein
LMQGIKLSVEDGITSANSSGPSATSSLVSLFYVSKP